MSSKLRLIFIIIAILLVGFLGWRMTRHSSGSGNLVVKAQSGPFVAELLQIGQVNAVNSTNITPRSWGKLADLVAEGTVVEKDQPIAWLETDDLERNVEKYQVDLDLAQKRLVKAEENARLQNRLNELAVQESRASLEYQKNQLVSAKAKLEKTRRSACRL